MSFILGYYIKATVTGKRSVENWAAPVADQFDTNISTVLGGGDSFVVMFVVSVRDARSTRGGGANSTRGAVTGACSTRGVASAPVPSGSKWYGPHCPKWLGPGAEYLTGKYAGDDGFDTLGLSKDGDKFAKNTKFGLLHARWAMLGRLGCVTPELLVKYSGVEVAESVRFKNGGALLDGTPIAYLNFPGLIHTQSFLANIATQVLLMGAVEYFRENSGPLGEAAGMYTGGAFESLGLGNEPDTLAELQVKEIKNGRLAMFSILEFYIQAAVAGEGHVENCAAHAA